MRRFLLVPTCITSVLSLILVMGNATAATQVSGQAFGVSIATNLTTAAPQPHVVIPPQGGSASNASGAFSAPGTLTTGALTVETGGTAGATTAQSDATAGADMVDLLAGLVTVDSVVAESNSSCDGATASSDAGASGFINLIVNGVPIAAPAPNTTIPVVGVGTVILNEQIPGGNGVDTSELTVNMIHIVLTGVETGDIIVASAHSDVDCVLPEPLPPTSVSGEGVGASAATTSLTVAPQPRVVLAPRGGTVTASSAEVDFPTALTTGVTDVETNGTAGPTSAQSDTTTTVQTPALLAGLISADSVTAVSNSSCDGTSAGSDAVGSAFVNLVVDGSPVASPAPNTVIPLPGVGSVILNEQVPGGDGVDTSELTVNMIHVVLTGVEAGDILIGSAHSDVDCAGAAGPTPTPFVCVPVPTPTPTATPTGPIVSGSAFGASIDLPSVVVPPVPSVVLPQTGGMVTAGAPLGIDAPGNLTTDAISLESTGTTTPTTAASTTTTTVSQVDALAGLVTADSLVAMSSSSCDTLTPVATSNDTGTGFTNLTVDGVPILTPPAPNTAIVVPAVGTVILNEQVAGGDGVNTSELTINMVRIVLDPPAGGEIIIGNAHSDVDCAPGNPLPVFASTVSGEAFGISADVPPVTVSPTPHVVLPPQGGMVSDSLPGVNEPGTVTSSTIDVESNGTTGPNVASSNATALVNDLDALAGVVTADTVTAVSASTCDGATASSSAAGSGFGNLVVAGVPVMNPAPNTMIPVLGVGTVILNEQIPGGNGVDTSELTVNMIRIELSGLQTGEIIVASAHSDVACAPEPAPTPTPTPTATPVETCTPVPTPTTTPGGEICVNGLDDDGDGLIDCLDPDCVCQPIGKDPARIRFGRDPGAGHDFFSLHGTIAEVVPFPSIEINPPIEEVGFILSDASGVLYAETIPPGSFEQRRTTIYLFKDRDARRAKSGVFKFTFKFRPRRGAWQIRIKSFGDLSGVSGPNMTVQIRVGTDGFFHVGTWRQVKRGWKLNLPGE